MPTASGAVSRQECRCLGLRGVRLVGHDQPGGRGADGAVAHDREQVVLGEPSSGRGDTERGIYLGLPREGGELDRGGNLGPDTHRPGCGGLDQPGRWSRRPRRPQRQRAQVGHDDQLIGCGANPHLRADQPGWRE